MRIDWTEPQRFLNHVWLWAMCHFFLLKVISDMRVLMTEDSNNAVSSSFLLDDDSRLNQIILSFILSLLFFCHWLSPLLMQHSIFCRWPVQINRSGGHFRCGTTAAYSWKFRLQFLVTTCWLIQFSWLFCQLAGHVLFNLRITLEVQRIWTLKIWDCNQFIILSNFPYFCHLILSASPIHCSTSFWIFCCSLCCNLKNKKQKGLAALMSIKTFNISVQPILPFILEVGGRHVTCWFLVWLVFWRILQSVVISMIQTVLSYTFPRC